MKTFLVGTFFWKDKAPDLLGSFSAYTTWYNPDWGDCIEYTIEAESGNEAKRKAILMRRDHEMSKWGLRGTSAGQAIEPTKERP